MKNLLLLMSFCCFCSAAQAQLRIWPGTLWVNNGSIVIVVNDMDYTNDGTVLPGNSKLVFAGSTPKNFGGVGIDNLYELEIAKTGNNKLFLSKSIAVSNRIIFSSGLIDLNQQNINLSSQALLFNETEASRITGLSGGELSIDINLNAPVSSNPGNLGAVITSASNLGLVQLKRGHKPQSGSGLASGIQRYYTITPANNASLNATLRQTYFDAELNNQSEGGLNMFKSTNAGATWTNENAQVRNSVQNFIENSGINSFSRWTLSSFSALSPDYTIVQSFPALGFPTAGFSRDFIVHIVNISSNPSVINPAIPLEFRIIKPASFTFTAGENTVVLNGNPVNNNDWIIDNSNFFYIKFILKNGAIIPANGGSSIGITVTRNIGVAPNTVGNVTSVIINGSGGESQFNNNTVVTQIVAN